jgi:hypothetical protein
MAEAIDFAGVVGSLPFAKKRLFSYNNTYFSKPFELG